MNLDRKGQGALEYVMTYGWAIAVVMLIGFSLWMLGIFNPDVSATNRCFGFAKLKCLEETVQYSGSSGVLVANFVNAAGSPITITEITGRGDCNFVTSYFDPSPIPVGGTTQFVCPSTGKNEGDEFLVEVNVTYTQLVANVPVSHTDKGTIRGRVEAVVIGSTSLIAYWKFDEGLGVIAADSSGNGHDIASLPGTWVTGIQGSAFKFIGSDTTYFEGGIGEAVSYDFWFKLPDDALDTKGTFLCTTDVSDSQLQDDLGQTPYGVRGCGDDWRTGELDVMDTEWHHFVFSKSSASTLCLDGDCRSVGDATGNIPNIDRITFNMGCGCGYGTFGQGIIIDEVKIYSN